MISTIPFDAYKGAEPFIFVSYAHKDRDVVFPLILALHGQGYRIWYDEGIDPGNEWPDEIAHALETSSQFLVFISPHAVASRNVRNEINLALEIDRKFIAIHLIETQLPSGLKLSMGSIQAILKWRMSDEHFSRKLAGSLSTALKGATAPLQVPLADVAEVQRAADAKCQAEEKRAADDKRAAEATRQAEGKRLAEEQRQCQHLASLRVPEGCRATAGTAAEPYSKSGWAQEVVHEATGMAFRFIPPGAFTMGSPAEEPGRSGDEIQHRVTLSLGFYLGKHPVTQAQWERVMGANPSHFKGADLPVEQVSWDDCQAFLKKLGAGARLPTEAEWEYACRAGTASAFSYGDKLDATMANFNGNYPYGGAARGVYREKTTAVGSFKPNTWGMFDMHGNVREWCLGWYGAYPVGAATDPQGAQNGSFRMTRGGSWDIDADRCRSANRDFIPPFNADRIIGFRAVLPPGHQ
jgi:formylglycine-generating enzyme required for sulfatase activity